jgi:hypothetical protein
VLAFCSTAVRDVLLFPNQLAGLTALSRIVPHAETARTEIRTEVVKIRIGLPALLFLIW